jgi:AbrB family looped-hinge helix DNA binding protein
MSVVTLSTKGQIVLPREIRQALGLQKGDKLRVTLEEGNRLVLTSLPSTRAQSWRRWRGQLAGTPALEEHLAEHAQEVSRERLP